MRKEEASFQEAVIQNRQIKDYFSFFSLHVCMLARIIQTQQYGFQMAKP